MAGFAGISRKHSGEKIRYASSAMCVHRRRSSVLAFDAVRRERACRASARASKPRRGDAPHLRDTASRASQTRATNYNPARLIFGQNKKLPLSLFQRSFTGQKAQKSPNNAGLQGISRKHSGAIARLRVHATTLHGLLPSSLKLRRDKSPWPPDAGVLRRFGMCVARGARYARGQGRSSLMSRMRKRVLRREKASEKCQWPANQWAGE